jgi:hypothetical protein
MCLEILIHTQHIKMTSLFHTINLNHGPKRNVNQFKNDPDRMFKSFHNVILV